MEKIPYFGQTLVRWRVGGSTFLALPEKGARLMNWNIAMGDGSVRDVIHWPEIASLADFHKTRGGNPILFPFCARSFDRGEAGFWRDARVLVAGRNFGGGSSREAAVYALVDYGIRCVVATSFGDIFAGNAVNNGLVAAIVSPEDIEKLLSAVEQTGKAEVDLEEQTITSPMGKTHRFEIDPRRRDGLLKGLDEVALTLQRDDEIRAFQAADRNQRPWIQFAGKQP